jgi:hypothetical protein
MSLIEDFAKAQAEMENPKFNKKNTFLRKNQSEAYEYADLTAVRNAVIPVLNKYHISLTQTVDDSEGGYCLLTTIRQGKEELTVKCPLLIGRMDMQSLGSAITYARRYSISNLCGLSSESDTDAIDIKLEETKTVEDAAVSIIRKAKSQTKEKPFKDRLQKASRDICTDLKKCTDMDELIACFSNPETQKVLHEMREKTPDFYKSCEDEKDRMKKELTPVEFQYKGIT